MMENKDLKDKYKMFKNFMFNDLCISKEDIREWVRGAVKSEIKDLVNQQYQNFNLRDMIKKEILDNDIWSGEKLTNDMHNKISRMLVESLELTVKHKGKK